MSQEIIASLASSLNVNDEDIITGSTQDMGCTDTHTCLRMIESVVTEYTVDIDFNKLTLDELDEIMIYGVHKYIIDEEGLARYEEIIAKQDEDVLFDDGFANYKMMDEPSTEDFNHFLDIVDNSAKILSKINGIRITWTDRFGNTEENLTRSGCWADVLRNDNMPARVAKWAKEKLAVQEVFLSPAMYTKYRNLWVKAYHTAQANSKKDKPRLLRRACDVTALVKVAQTPMWNEYKELQDCIHSIVNDDSSMWPAFYREQETEINRYLTSGEVDPELEDYSLHSESLDRGADLAYQHLKEMEMCIPGFSTYDDILTPKALPGDEPRPRTGGYCPRCRTLDPKAYANGIVQDKWLSTQLECNDTEDEGYVASLLADMQ